MFEFLLWAVIAMVAAAMVYAYAGSRDVFHPVMFIGPMMGFLYAWMPMKLYSSGGLDGFFQADQLIFVQVINIAGVAAFLIGCLGVGCKLPDPPVQQEPVSESSARVLTIVGIVLGCIGVGAWGITIINVGGFTDAFSQAYSGGWDDSGYVRDASLLMFPSFLLILCAATRTGILRIAYIPLLVFFIGPWVLQAALTARRGPTFMISTIITMGWYLTRRKRPSLVVAAVTGATVGFLMLFLVTNRQNIHLGSDASLTTDVSSIVEKPDTGNEYIYGTGAILASEQVQKFYWGRRMLAQVVIRPIPSAVWPTKYEDFGLPELNHNAGTGEGFAEALGWEGAVGSAPGIISDLWLEFRWLNLPALWILGKLFGLAWKKTHLVGGPWVTQYIIAAALSIYFVMQTMEAVIFRTLILSIPLWLAWRGSGWHRSRTPQMVVQAPLRVSPSEM
jgi:hypothetical protein